MGADSSWIQDEYRVILFDDQGSDAFGFIIPTHATPPPNFRSTKTEGYLRNHFKRCLHVHLCGGDIHSQYTSTMVMNLMSELGVGGYDSDPEDVTVPPPDDERWHTELGQVIYQSTLEWGEAINRWESPGHGGTRVSDSSDADTESDSSP
jgi:hypothetical protein